MTSDDGKVLAQCAAQLATLETVGQSFNLALGRLEEDHRATRDIVSQNTAVVADMKRVVIDELLTAVRGVPELIDGKLRYHEENDPIHKAAREAHEKDITEKFQTQNSKSIPPEVVLRRNREKLKNRLLHAGIWFLIAATSVLTTLAAV